MRGLRPARYQVILALAVLMLSPGAAGAGLTEVGSAPGQPASSRIPRTPGADPRRFLPGNGAIPGWTRSEEPRVFDDKTLFAHIDGGAEEFLARGFRALGVGGYRRDSLEIVAEIYDQGTAKGAAAILEARGGGDTSSPALADSIADAPPAVGDACVLDAMQVIFRRNRFYVTVTGFEARPEVTAALRVLADSIDARIRAAGRNPGTR